MDRYKRKTDKISAAKSKASNQYEDRAANMDDYDSPVKSGPKRRPSVQKKLDIAFADAKTEKQRLTVVYD